MNPSTTIPTNATVVDVEFSGKRVSFADNCPTIEELNQANVPLLLQPSYARSKSLIFDELRKFRISLRWFALDHSTCVGKLISYFVFIFLTIFVPIITLLVHVPASAPADDPISLNKLVQVPESALAIIAFFTLSRFFQRYGLRQLLFLDGLQDDSSYVRHGYTDELDKAFRYLACILLPSFFIELAHKIIFFSTVKITIPSVSPGFPLNSIAFVLVLVSWVYRTGAGEKALEGFGSDTDVIFREHVRIKKQLWVTSHRYRFFIIGCFVTLSVSQLGSLLLVLATKSHKSFFNSGDLVICSAVQLGGFFLCLFGAARITHRAQGIVSIATRWHMLMTSTAAGSEQRKAHLPEAPAGDSDSDSSDNINLSVPPQEPSSFQTRQALVTYLQHNNGGITLFGFALDRGLLHTLFAFEFSLVLWILSKVVVLH
ncbi:Extracellular ligand-gated ion channel protein [Quillaja saponaria]|uniref:Extracellular ligand-gated ion channel protein n=1 Tax=Quillaja saponaria TaxID=32244 RepID=A0AAD7LZN2_QUISA|nr:Extracellular ligand-gated ion channel protein [Quillaja saponaria]